MTARAIDNGGGQPNDGGKSLDLSKDIVHQILDMRRESGPIYGGPNPGFTGDRQAGNGSIAFTNCFPVHKKDIWERANSAPKGDDMSKPPETVTMRNGDKITIGGPEGFTIVDKNGCMVQRTLEPAKQVAYDLPVSYKLSNGATYVTRGGWNHDEFISYPNGDYVHFTDAGKLVSSKINGKEKQYA